MVVTRSPPLQDGCRRSSRYARERELQPSLALRRNMMHPQMLGRFDILSSFFFSMVSFCYILFRDVIITNCSSTIFFLDVI